MAIERSARLVLWTFSLTLAAIWGIAAFAGTTMFMTSTNRKHWAVNEFAERHYCATAYWIAADLALHGAELPYDPEHYRADASLERSGDLPGRLGEHFEVDAFPYLPPFLLLPSMLLSVTRNITALRTLWFTLTAGLLLFALFRDYQRAASARVRRREALAALIFLGSFPLQLSLQVGNAQVLLVSLVILSANALERERQILGSSLLGFVVLSKGWPAAVLLPLFALRGWRDLLTTLACSLLYALLTLAWLGPTPFAHFFGFELDWILNGQAFPFLAQARTAADNVSLPGLAHKAEILGWTEGPFPLVHRGLAVTSTIFVAALALWGCLRYRRDTPQSLTLLSLATLCLAQLLSPFLASCLGAIAPLCLIVVMIGRAGPKLSIFLALAFAGLVFPPPEATMQRSLVTLVQTLLTIALACVALFSRVPDTAVSESESQARVA